MPWKHQHAPRRRLNPITVATVALQACPRLWRDAFPIKDDGTAIVLHQLSAPFRARHPGSVPRPLPLAPRRAHGGGPRCGRAGGGGRQARARRLPGRPRLPPAPSLRRLGQLPAALERLGAVVVAGCRDFLGGADARVRADARGLERARDGARPCRRRGSDRLSARPAYFPLEVGAMGTEDLVFQKHKRSFAAR